MRVKIEYTLNVDDNFRRAINLYYGKPGLATRAEVKRWFMAYGNSENDNLMYDLAHEEERESYPPLTGRNYEGDDDE